MPICLTAAVLNYRTRNDDAVRIVDLLVKKGADAKAVFGETEDTLLHIYAMHNNISSTVQGRRLMEELLIQCGVDPSAKNKAGLTPADINNALRSDQVVDALTAGVAALRTASPPTLLHVVKNELLLMMAQLQSESEWMVT